MVSRVGTDSPAVRIIRKRTRPGGMETSEASHMQQDAHSPGPDAARIRRHGRPLLLLAVLLPLVLFGGFAWFDYDVELNRARDHAVAITDALAEHTQAVVETADLALDRILDHVQGQEWASFGPARTTHDFLAALTRQLPQLESAFLVTPAGIKIASSRGFPLPGVSEVHHAYFTHALTAHRRPYISAPFQQQTAGIYAFTITRPRLREGRFDGLAGVTISPGYFASFFDTMLENPSMSAVALVRDDGQLLLRYPAARNGGPIRLGPATPLMQAIAAGTPSGVVGGPSSIDGHERLVAFKRLHGWPLIATYSMDRTLYLRHWYFHLAFFAAFAVLLGLALALLERLTLRRAEREHAALVLLFQETSRRQQAEAALQQAQKLEALGRLTGGIAHDFNNLLAAIMGCQELLQKYVSGARAERLLATAQQAAKRGAQLTAQMLAFARRKDIAVQPVDVNAVIRGMDHLLHQAIGSNVAIRYALDDTLGLAVADSGQLEMALLNLAVNARDAMPKGGELRFATTRSKVVAGAGEVPGLATGDYVRISVTDTGQGMTEEVRARAFEPFFTTKEPSKGTGLGLSMAFGFASLVGGTVTLQSAPGRGTSISLYLPAAAAEPETASLPQQDALPAAHPGATAARVLLVDDDADVRSTTQVMLEGLAEDVVAVDSGKAALEVLRADRRFDLLIIDFAMPGMNGSQLASEIRRTWPDAPLLFVTGYVENDALKPWRELGVPSLNKPFSRADLAAALAGAVGRPRESLRA
jgi:two-component system NtrC family sensor kinase